MKDWTEITLLLDRTGSMGSIKSDVIGGVNEFIERQKRAGDNATFTLVQFDCQDPQEIVCDTKPIQDAPQLTEATYQPRGRTPLLDALGQCIVRTGERLAGMAEQNRPDKVVFVIVTDGQENASREYSRTQIKDMVTRQSNDYKWQFVYIGADVDSFAEAGGMGIGRRTSADYDRAKFRQAMGITGHGVASYRATGSAQSLHYSGEDRQKMS